MILFKILNIFLYFSVLRKFSNFMVLWNSSSKSHVNFILKNNPPSAPPNFVLCKSNPNLTKILFSLIKKIFYTIAILTILKILLTFKDEIIFFVNHCYFKNFKTRYVYSTQNFLCSMTNVQIKIWLCLLQKRESETFKN